MKLNKLNMEKNMVTSKEFDEFMKEEIEAGNPFCEYKSYASYKASNRKKPTEKKETQGEENKKTLPAAEN